jgi:hypothetical protein
MSRAYLRATLQGTFLLLFLPVLFFLGLGCLCYSPPPAGSDMSHGELPPVVQTKDVQAGPALVMRYHSIPAASLAATLGEARAISEALPSTIFGMRIPTAADRNQPGELYGGVSAAYTINNSPTLIPLKPEPSLDAELNRRFPPAEGTQWVALVVSDTSSLSRLLGAPIDLRGVNASLTYAIDFGGTEPCPGCEVKLVSCVPGKFGALLPPALRAATAAASDQAFQCTAPVSTYIVLYDFGGNQLPGPTSAAFGLWGSLTTTSTVGGTTVMPVMLEHTGPTTITFTLDPLLSALGWSYAWQNAQGVPITQIAVGPHDPSNPSPAPNLRIVGSGVPTCTQAIDVLSLRAAGVVTPSLQANAEAYVNVLPDAASCPTADVAARHIQATSVISGGTGITYTLTISNLTNSQVDGLIQQTLTPASAVTGAELPAGCQRNSGVVTCLVSNIPAKGAESVTVVIKTRKSYGGDLVSVEQVNPSGATDDAFLDNIDGPLTVNVQANGTEDKYYLPIIKKP